MGAILGYEGVMRQYYRVLEARDLGGILGLFSENAIIRHPIFGDTAAPEFFKILLDRAKSHSITIKSIFSTTDPPNRAATFLGAQFVSREDTHFDEDAVHIFDFDPEGRVELMTVILDTYPFRGQYSAAH